MKYIDCFEEQDIKKAKLAAGIAYFGVTFFLPLLAIPQSSFGRFHANQALGLLILFGAGLVVSAVLSYISISVFLSYSMWCVVYVASLMYHGFLVLLLGTGMVFAFRGKAPLLPIAKKFSFIKY